MASSNSSSNNMVVGTIQEIGEAFGAVPERPEANRPLGVVYVKCFLRCSVTALWAWGVSYILQKFKDNPGEMISVFQSIALPAGIVLTHMSKGCLKLSLQADSLSSLKELRKRFTEGVLQKALTQALLTPDLLKFAEGKNVELGVQMDERIYREACLDLMVKSLIKGHQDGRNTRLSRRRCQSESNINLMLNASHSLNELPLEVKSKKERRELKIEEYEGKQETPPKSSRLPAVLFSTIDEETVSQKTMVGVPEKLQAITGKVEMLAISNRQISNIKVYASHVYAENDESKQKLVVTFDDYESASKEKLPVTFDDYKNKKYFSVDTADVDTEPLSMMYLKKWNVFKLSAVLYFTDGTKSEEFFSKPFNIATHSRESKPASKPTPIEVETLVCDEVFASIVKKGTMTRQKPKSTETRSTGSKVCTKLVRAEMIIAQTISYETLSGSSPTELDFPIQWDGGISKTKEDPLDMAGNSEFAENSTSCITARIIGVKHLIVRRLTYNKLTDLP